MPTNIGRQTGTGGCLVVVTILLILFVIWNILPNINPIYLAITIALILSLVIYGRIRKRQSRNRSRTVMTGLQFLVIVVFLAIPLYFIIGILAQFWIYLAFIAAIVLAVLTYIWLKGYRRLKRITSEIHKHLLKALKIMDTTYKWYNDEGEANRELVTSLKSQGSLFSDAVYQYRLPNGRVADAKVGVFLIEGKLSPDTAEVDRLIGQLSDYTQHGKVNIVIYGKLNKDARRRIENEILLRYENKVFLTCLDDPRRQRLI